MEWCERGGGQVSQCLPYPPLHCSQYGPGCAASAVRELALLPNLVEAGVFLQQECWVGTTRLGGSSQESFSLPLPPSHVFSVCAFTMGCCLAFVALKVWLRRSQDFMCHYLCEARLLNGVQSIAQCVFVFRQLVPAFIRELLLMIGYVIKAVS